MQSRWGSGAITSAWTCARDEEGPLDSSTPASWQYAKSSVESVSFTALFCFFYSTLQVSLQEQLHRYLLKISNYASEQQVLIYATILQPFKIPEHRRRQLANIIRSKKGKQRRRNV